MNNKETDFEFMIRILPNYFITCDQKPGLEIWRCRSNSGISDSEKFEYVIKAIKQRWPGRYITIHLKNEHAWDGPIQPQNTNPRHQKNLYLK